MHTHPYVVPGLFKYVKKVDDANVVVIPYGIDDNRAQLVDPPVMRSPAILPAPTLQIWCLVVCLRTTKELIK